MSVNHNDESEYAENCLDLQGIKRYNIFRYFDELNMLLPVATQFDEENNTLYAETDELGTYCLLDMEILLQQLNIAPDGETFESATRPMLLAASEEDIEEYCVTFIFDIRKGKITSEQLKKMKDDVSHFADEVFAFNPNTAIRLLTQNVSDFDDESFNVICDSAVTLDEVNTALDKIKISRNSGVFGDYCIISEALAYVADNSDASVNNYIFDFYNQDEAIFENDISYDLLDEIKNRNINVSVISPEADSITGYQKMLSDSTGGITIGKSGDSGYRRLYQHVYDKKVVDQSFRAILITGYHKIELKGKLSAYNNIDTDDDTLTDWEEVNVEHWIEKGLITYDNSENIVLPTIKQCMRFAERSYVEEGLERFISDYGVNFRAAILGTRVLPIRSDPTREDSDEDGLLDGMPQYYNDKMIAPKDNENPLKYDGPKGAWTNHIKSSKTNMVTEYSSDYGPMGVEVVNEFLTVLESDIKIEMDTVDSKMLHLDLSFDLIISIPYKSIDKFIGLLYVLWSENQEYIRFGGETLENSICISIDALNGILGDFAPRFEIAQEQLDDYIANLCDFIDRNYQYLQSLFKETDGKKFDIELVAISNSFELNADWVIDEILLKYLAPFANKYKDKLSPIFSVIKEVGEGNTALGAKILHFVLDDDGVAYHSQPSTWQRAFGYNDFYDLAFDIGSYMDKARYDFKSNDVTYGLWMWKGDYWNLQSGAEIGLYYIDKNRPQVSRKAPHYYSIDYTLPMSLSLYNCDGDHYTNVFCWYPDEEQWWVTGFNAHSEFCEPVPEDMIAIGAIDFSSKTDLYNSLKGTNFKDKSHLKNYFYFDDDNHFLWIIFTEDDEREYNFA